MHPNQSQHLAEGTEVVNLRWRLSFVLRQAFSFRTRHHLYRQGVALGSTRRLRSQGSVSVHARRIEEVIGSKGREAVNGVGGGNGDVNGDGDGDGAGTGTGVEANEGTQDGIGDGAGTGTGTAVETRGRTQDGNGAGSGDGNESSSGDGNGDEDGNGGEDGKGMRMGTNTRTGTGTGTWTGSGGAEKRRGSAGNHTRIVDAIRHVYSACVIISADRGGACRHPTAPFARPVVCTRASHQGGNRVRGTGRSKRSQGRDRSRGRERRQGRGQGWKWGRER